MLKKITQIFLSLILIFNSLSISSFAMEEIDTDKLLLPSIENYELQNERIPNGVPISIKANSDGTGCKVYVGNVGIDRLDLVTVKVEATGYSKAKTQSSKVIPVAGKTFSFNFPMIKANTTYKATVTIRDGGKTKVKTGTAKLEYSESRLNSIWHKGTFSTRAKSLEYHFGKHGKETGSSNLVSYINKAIKYRSEVMRSLTNIKVTIGTGKIPSKKYKNKKDGRFIILTDNSKKEILSFGI